MGQLEDNEANRQAVVAFVSSWLRGQEAQQVAMHGTLWSTDDEFLGLVVDGLSLSLNFMPPSMKFIDQIHATIDERSGLTASAIILNPMPTNVVFNMIDINVRDQSFDGYNIFVLDS